MNMRIEVNENTRVEVDDFNSHHDVSVKMKQLSGDWIALSGVVLNDAQAISLAVCLINRTPDAARILKLKYLSEDKLEKVREASACSRTSRTRPAKSIYEQILGVQP